MRGLGARLKRRAGELGLTDVEVARRLGIAQGRYSSWSNDVHEPDLETVIRIARVLGMTADQVLGVVEDEANDADAALRARAALALGDLSGAPLAGAVAMVEALARVAAASPEPVTVPALRGRPKSGNA